MLFKNAFKNLVFCSQFAYVFQDHLMCTQELTKKIMQLLITFFVVLQKSAPPD